MPELKCVVLVEDNPYINVVIHNLPAKEGT
jgi:hypothetical protein